MNRADLEKLQDVGVNFTYSRLLMGYVDLSVDDIFELLKIGPDRFNAKVHGVTLEHYEEWLKHWNNPTCHGVNRKGEPCQGYLPRIAEPQDFDLEYDIYCVHHKPYGG